MPKRRDPMELAVDRVLRALDKLPVEQRALALNTVRLVLDRTGAAPPRTERKPRVKREPAPPAPNGHASEAAERGEVDR